MKPAHTLAALVLLAGTAFAGAAMAQEEQRNGRRAGSAAPIPMRQPRRASTRPPSAPTATSSTARTSSSAKNKSKGVYEVIFNANVKKCVRVASIGLPNTGDPPPGIVSTAALNNNNKWRLHPHRRHERIFAEPSVPPDRHLPVSRRAGPGAPRAFGSGMPNVRGQGSSLAFSLGARKCAVAQAPIATMQRGCLEKWRESFLRKATLPSARAPYWISGRSCPP